MKRNYWYYGLSNWFKKYVLGMERVRARNEKGQYVGDDKSTLDDNEAYIWRNKWRDHSS
jgi:hypothetical protein